MKKTYEMTTTLSAYLTTERREKLRKTYVFEGHKQKIKYLCRLKAVETEDFSRRIASR